MNLDVSFLNNKRTYLSCLTDLSFSKIIHNLPNFLLLFLMVQMKLLMQFKCERRLEVSVCSEFCLTTHRIPIYKVILNFSFLHLKWYLVVLCT